MWIVPIALATALFFIVGVLFAYYVAVPLALRFSVGLAAGTLQPQISIDSYLDFMLEFALALGLVFELPLVIFALARFGIVTASGLRKFCPHAFIAALILGAVLTPPDVVSQVVVAGPLYVLYEISIGVAAIFGRRPTGA